MIRILFEVALAGGSAWAGYAYGSRAVAKVKADLVRLEEGAKALEAKAQAWVLAEVAKIKAKL